MCCELQSCSLWSLRHRLSHMEMKQCSNSMAVPTTIANIPLLPHTLANRSAFFFLLYFLLGFPKPYRNWVVLRGLPNNILWRSGGSNGFYLQEKIPNSCPLHMDKISSGAAGPMHSPSNH